MKLSQLREFVKQVVREEQDYQQLFKHMLDKVGKSITDMSDDEKKKFFSAVDTAYKAKSEGRLRGYNEAELTAGQKKIDVDGDGEIEGSDLAKLRAKNESLPKWNTEREATKMAVGKGRYDDKVIVNRTTKQADIYNDYMNNVAKDDNDRTWASRLIWHSESQGEFNNNFEKLEKLVAKHK